MDRKNVAVHAVLGAVLLITLFLGVLPALAAPSGLILPFRGRAEIAQGPRCRYSHYSGIDLEAIDFVMSLDRPIYAAQSGVAYLNRNTWPGGNMVTIHHSGYKTIYAHLNRFESNLANYFFNYPNNGVWVNKDQLIGYAGRTGNASGVHLHFAALDYSNRPIKIYDIPGLTWWERNPATQWCILNGRNEGVGVR